jgi:hypothetical protein
MISESPKMFIRTFYGIIFDKTDVPLGLICLKIYRCKIYVYNIVLLAYLRLYDKVFIVKGKYAIIYSQNISFFFPLSNSRIGW